MDSQAIPYLLLEYGTELFQELVGDDLKHEIDALHLYQSHAVLMQKPDTLDQFFHVVCVAGVGADYAVVLFAQRNDPVEMFPDL